MGFKFRAPKMFKPSGIVRDIGKTINKAATDAGTAIQKGVQDVGGLVGLNAPKEPEVPGDTPLDASLKAPDAAAATVAAMGQQVEDNKRRRAFRTLFTGGLGLGEQTQTTSASNSLLGS